MKELTHISEDGSARMVDVSAKPDSLRHAMAQGDIFLDPGTVQLIKDKLLKKGDVLSVSEIAATMAAKQTSGLIPLCHTILITDIKAKSEIRDHGVRITCTVGSAGKTGVEMEALTGVSIGLLTVYDMCKAVDKHMVIGDIKLMEKKKKEIERL